MQGRGLSGWYLEDSALTAMASLNWSHDIINLHHYIIDLSLELHYNCKKLLFDLSTS